MSPACAVLLQTAVGYTQGKTENPTYQDVCSGTSGHVEAVLVEYDPSQVSYDTLLDVFWHKHDPTQKDGQVSCGVWSTLLLQVIRPGQSCCQAWQARECMLSRKKSASGMPAERGRPSQAAA